MDTFNVKSIGFIKLVDERESISDIILNRELTDTLDGTQEYSHLYVLYWMHKLEVDESVLKIHPWGDKKLPYIGVLATRTQFRPNPIGLTLVRLLKRTKNVLRVKGLDALDGTPILDLKPFDPWDIAEFVHFKFPKWWTNRRKEEWMQWQKLIKYLQKSE